MLIDDINGSTVAPVVARTEGQTVILILTFLLYHVGTWNVRVMTHIKVTLPFYFLFLFLFFYIYIHIFYYSTTYIAYKEYNTNNVHITYEANYNNNETILRLDTTKIRLI